ncbi:hypothetical protein PG996_011041 [Apiospora saccharicola]|uniref:Uncharacterized protein n=1 Tax=Apiospora saccharicola TaxID=335842 RepID=A0ABR1UDY3_9PEZI
MTVRKYDTIAPYLPGRKISPDVATWLRNLAEHAVHGFVEHHRQRATWKSRGKRTRKRLGLPITFEGQLGDSALIACANTGADSNVIAYATAKSLDLPISTAQDAVKEFQLANGKIVKSIGIISLRCVLAPGRLSMVTGLTCFFYVFETLAVPLILGMPLLEATETLSKFHDRLVEQTIPAGLALQVSHIGSPRRRPLCSLDGSMAAANLDSGSDADFLSAQFAQFRGFIVEENQGIIMFADGSTEFTCGVIHLPLALEAMQPLTLEFHVCTNLAHDVIVGQDYIQNLEIFTHHSSSLISSEDASMIMSLEPIRLLEKLDFPGFSKLKAKLKKITELPSNLSQIQQPPLSEPLRPGGALLTVPPSLWEVPDTPADPYVCKLAGCQAGPSQDQYLL